MPIWTLYGLKRGIATTAWPGKDNAEVQPGVLGLPRFQAGSLPGELPCLC